MRIILLNLTLAMPILLAVTATEWFPSLSAFANAENQIFYNAMHLFGSWLFIQNASAQNRDWDYVIGMGMGAILLTNMYDFPVLHNIATAITFISALWGMFYYSSDRTQKINLVLASLAAIFFCGGLWTDLISLYLGETLAIFCVGVNMARRITIKKDA